MPSTPSTKAYVGIANSEPDSLTPRRFIAVSSTMAPTANSTLWVATNGMTEPMLAAAEEIDTATVRM